MALDTSNGYAAANTFHELNDPSLPIFNIERVQLQFSIGSDFVAAQVANNVLVLALSSGRILRIDLDNAEDIDGMLHVVDEDSRLTLQTLTCPRRHPRLA
jgi:vacuolar protein sorting-associated protein 18